MKLLLLRLGPEEAASFLLQQITIDGLRLSAPYFTPRTIKSDRQDQNSGFTADGTRGMM